MIARRHLLASVDGPGHGVRDGTERSDEVGRRASLVLDLLGFVVLVVLLIGYAVWT